jgi:putative serine protease PepD
VIEGASTIEVTVPGSSSPRAATVIASDTANDLALLKVANTSGLVAAPLGSSADLQVGDDVVAIGNALDLDGGLSATRGIVSGLHRQIPTETGGQLQGLIQTDAAINPGNSGGPLVDAQGRVIGINTAIANPNTAQNVGFVIPISPAKPIIDRLRGGQ